MAATLLGLKLWVLEFFVGVCGAFPGDEVQVVEHVVLCVKYYVCVFERVFDIAFFV